MHDLGLLVKQGLLVLFLLAGTYIHAQAVFTGQPEIRAFQSDAIGLEYAPLAISDKPSAQKIISAWGELLADPAKAASLWTCVSGFDPKAPGSWIQVVYSGRGLYDFARASIQEKPADGAYLAEVPAAGKKNDGLVIKLFVPPRDSGESLIVMVTCTYGDGTVLEDWFRQGLRTNQVSKDAQGLELQEFRYRDGVCVLGTRNSYRNGRLTKAEIFGPQGLQLTNHLSYTSAGSLREEWQEYPDSSVDRTTYGSSPAQGSSQWISTKDGEQQSVFDRENRLSRKDLWKDKVLVERSDYQYLSPGSKLLISILTEFFQDKRKVLELYDESGRLSRRDQTRDGKLEVRESFVYDEAGNVVQRMLSKDKKVFQWDNAYESGLLKVESYQENSLPVWEIRHTGTGKEEDIYVKGLLSLRNYYDLDGRKVRQDEFKGGKIVGTKEY